MAPATGAPAKAKPAERRRPSLKDAEGEKDLRDFLKVVRPDWSLITRGGSDLDRVVAKLRDIGVYDIWELTRRVQKNTLDIDLTAAGHSHFSAQTLERMRSEGTFIRAMETLREPYYRQIGVFAPVPQLLAKTDRKKDQDRRSASICGETSKRPSTAPEASRGGRGGGKRPQNRASVADSQAWWEEWDGPGDAEPGAAGFAWRPSALAAEGRGERLQERGGPRPERQQLRFTSDEARRSLGARPRSSGALRRGDGGRAGPARVSRSASASGSSATGDDEDHGRASRAGLEAQVEQVYREGVAMVRNPRQAAWVVATPDNLVRRAEAMISEVQALEEKDTLFKQMQREGPTSSTRQAITANIKGRLLADPMAAKREMGELFTQSQRITQNMQRMQDSRRELTSVRQRAHDELNRSRKSAAMERFKADFKDMKPAASNADGGGADASLQPMPRGSCSPIDERGGSKGSCFVWDAEEHRLV